MVSPGMKSARKGPPGDNGMSHQSPSASPGTPSDNSGHVDGSTRPLLPEVRLRTPKSQPRREKGGSSGNLRAEESFMRKFFTKVQPPEKDASPAETKASNSTGPKMKRTGKPIWIGVDPNSTPNGAAKPSSGTSSSSPSGSVLAQSPVIRKFSNAVASPSLLSSDEATSSGPSAGRTKMSMVEAMRRYCPQDLGNWEAIHGKGNTRTNSTAYDRGSDVEPQLSSSKDTSKSVGNDPGRYLSSDQEKPPTIFKRAPSGRFYSDFRDENGNPTRESAWQIPDGYELDYTIPGFPWICPLRNCSGCYPSSAKMANHMRYHPEVLNDNGDGTFTSLGKYQDQKGLPPRGQFQGPVVIQQTPITQQDSSTPRKSPQLSLVYRRSLLGEKSDARLQSAASTSEEVPRREVDQVDLVAAETFGSDTESDLSKQPESSERDEEVKGEDDEEEAILANAPSPLRTAPSGRLYTKCPFDVGHSGLLTYGALLPDGYTLSDNIEFPWICPVRSCRQLFRHISNLGAHTTAGHCGCLFNDNLDGTLSEIGSLRKKSQMARPRCFVVSQSPLDKTEPPMPSPSLPKIVGRGTSRRDNTFRSEKSVHGDTAKVKVMPMAEANAVETNHEKSLQVQPSPILNLVAADQGVEGPGFVENAAKTWEYVKPLLGVAEDVIPNSPLLPVLLRFPQQREVDWNRDWLKTKSKHGNFVATMGSDIVCIVLQVVGKVSPIPCQACSLGRGPFKTCVTTPDGASLDLQAKGHGCANCLYKNNKAGCSFCVDNGHTDGHTDGHGSTVTFDRVFRPGQKRKLAIDDDDDDVDFPEPRTKRLDLGVEGNQLAKMQRRRRRDRDESMPTPENSGDDEVSRSFSGFDDYDAAQNSKDALICGGSAQPSVLDNLELEAWEMAPGRLMNKAGDIPVAYSKCFVRGSEVRLNSEVSFRVETLESAQKLKLEPDQTFRWVSVAQGKVTVDMDGVEEKYRGGFHSVHRIESGRSCTITNASYGEAVLHINSLSLD